MKYLLAYVVMLLIISVAMSATWQGNDIPTVSIRRLNKEPQFGAVAGKLVNSDFKYNYNAAYVPEEGTDVFTMAMRVQNLVPNATSIYDVGPSKIAITSSLGTFKLTEINTFTYINQSQVIIDNNIPIQSLGAEDPRIVLYNRRYYLFYSAVSPVVNTTDVRSQLSLATCELGQDIRKAENWKLHGPLFPKKFWSKSGALLNFNETHHYLFFGDKEITIATSTNLLEYVDTEEVLIKVREDRFDSELVESGPEPLKLQDGNYIFLYNSARKTTKTSPKPGWQLEYNIGYAILDGQDPTKVIYRSDTPLMSPDLPWEKCDDSVNEFWKKNGLTPNVVFVEGWKRIGTTDKFLVIYQGCDSFTGFFVLEVKFKEPLSAETVLFVFLASGAMLLLTSVVGLIYYFIHGRYLKRKEGFLRIK